MTIEQIRCSKVLRGNSYRPNHCLRVMKLLGLKPYKNNRLGTLFYGCYNNHDYKIINYHKGKAVILWGGSDVKRMNKNKFKFKKNIKHIVFTRPNMAELKVHGIDAEVKPMMFLDTNKFKLCPMGNSVFCYVPYRRAKFYGLDVIKKVALQLPDINFILVRYSPKPKPFKNCTVYPLLNMNRLIQIYRSCFCSIRPTKHDGLPQSICELGLMGRKTGWIYNSPIAMKCAVIDDYVNFIKNERVRKKPRKQLREKILEMSDQSKYILDGH